MTNGSQKLPSDWSHRKDIKKLLTETDPDNFDEAQLLKETLEEDQRHDAKLRKKHLEYLEEIRHKKGK